MKSLWIVGIVSVLLILASCSMNVENSVDLGDQGELINGVVYGKLSGYEILEHRLIIGYSDRSAVDKIVEKLGGEVYLELKKLSAVAIRIPMKVEDAMRILKAMKLDGIRYVEPSYRRYIIDPNPGAIGNPPQLTRIAGTEEFWSLLWGLQKINVESAWNEGYTGEGIVVAVVDTPIDGQHPDLMGQFVTGYDPELNVEIPPDTDYQDPLNSEDDHGTHVAGTIAAKRDGQGVVGIAYNAKIMPILIFRGTEDHESYYYVGDEYAAAGIIWAVDHGADVLSNSWGGGGFSHVLKAAVDYALKNGAVFVAAAGNGHTDQHWHYPSAYPGVIAVAASTPQDKIVDFSSRSDYLSVAAPGVNVLSTIPHNAGYGVYGRPYDFWGGTSMATPHVSGLVALLLQKYPDATPYQIRKMLENSAVDIEEPEWDHSAGYGRISVPDALSQNPSEYHGVIYHVEVNTQRSNTGIPSAYVTLKRAGGSGSDYYSVTNEYGVADFYYIDPGEYEVVVGGPDLCDSMSPVLRQEEQTGTSYSTTLTASESTDIVHFDTQLTFIFDMKAGDTAYLISYSDYYVLGEIISVWQYTTPEDTSVSVELWEGQVIIMYSVENPVAEDTMVEAKVLVNGTEIPVWGVITAGSTYTFLDDYGGEEPPFWWTAF